MIPWALGNYPAGSNPWNGQPLRVNPNYRFFTPNVPFTAEELNFLFGQAFDASTNGVTVPGAGWKPLSPVSVTGDTAFTGAHWDVFIGEWLLIAGASNGNGTSIVVSSQGCGDADYPLGTNVAGSGNVIPPGGAPFGVVTDTIFDGSHYFATMVENTTGFLHVFRAAPGGGWAPVLTVNSACTDAKILFFAGNIVVTACTTGSAFRYNSPIGDGASGHWNNISGTVPDAGLAIYPAANDNIMVWFETTGGGSTHYVTQTDLTQPVTVRAVSGFMTHSGETAWGLCYSNFDNMFVLSTHDGTTARFYNSPDGIAWTQVGSFTSFTHTRGMAATQSGCLSLMVDDGSNNCLALYSVNAGGSWYEASFFIPAPGFTALTFLQVAGSPAGFCAVSGENLRFSNNAGVQTTPIA